MRPQSLRLKTSGQMSPIGVVLRCLRRPRRRRPCLRHPRRLMTCERSRSPSPRNHPRPRTWMRPLASSPGANRSRQLLRRARPCPQPSLPSARRTRLPSIRTRPRLRHPRGQPPSLRGRRRLNPSRANRRPGRCLTVHHARRMPRRLPSPCRRVPPRATRRCRWRRPRPPRNPIPGHRRRRGRSSSVSRG